TLIRIYDLAPNCPGYPRPGMSKHNAKKMPSPDPKNREIPANPCTPVGNSTRFGRENAHPISKERKTFAIQGFAYWPILGTRESLLHFPDVAAAQQLVQVSGPFLLDDVVHLLVHDVLITRQVVPSAEQSDGRRETGPPLHVRKQERVGRPRMVRVVHNQIR